MKMSTNPRLLEKDVLTLYKSTFYAIKELTIFRQMLMRFIPSTCPVGSINYRTIESVEVIDYGEGVSFSDFENCIMLIATDNKTEGQGIGRFGATIGKRVGR